MWPRTWSTSPGTGCPGSSRTRSSRPDTERVDLGEQVRLDALCVAHRLLAHLAGDLVGEHPDVIRGAHQVDDRQIHVDERREVLEPEVVGERGLILRYRSLRMPLGQL